jgi:hypothetical protein
VVALEDLLLRYHFDKPIEIDSDVFADQYTPYLAQMVKQVDDDTKYKISKKVVAWYKKGDEPIGKLIEDLQPTFSKARAKNIAMTEVTRLNSGVQDKIADAIGMKSWWWQTMRDDLVCTRPLVGPDGKTYNGCRGLHGKVFSREHKGPPDGSHPGCRCNKVYLVSQEFVFKVYGDRIAPEYDLLKNQLAEALLPQPNDIQERSLYLTALDPLRPGEQMVAYFVNGDAIRDLQFVDFALGGNDQIYSGQVEGKPLLCEPSVFIIDRTNADEAPFILLHESIERRKMLVDGWTYDDAHDYANIYGEEVARADPSKLPDMLAAEGWTVDKTVANYALLKADWEEAKHPRDQKGEFASEGGGNNSNNMGQEDPKKQLPRTVDLTNVKSWDDITKEFDKAIDDVTFSVESHGNTYTGMSKIRTNKENCLPRDTEEVTLMRILPKPSKRIFLTPKHCVMITTKGISS